MTGEGWQIEADPRISAAGSCRNQRRLGVRTRIIGKSGFQSASIGDQRLSVSRHAGYNLLGAVIPIGLSLITVPIYLRLIGPDRYGVLAIAWLLLGYFGLFDLGLGRATTYRVASLRHDAASARANTFWAALSVNVLMGTFGGLALWAAAEYFFGHIFKVDEKLRREILAAVPLLAIAVPFATLSGVLTGAMQGRERFLEINLISVVSTALFQILPLTLAWTVGPELPLLLGAALSARLVTVILMGFRCYTDLAAGHAIRVEAAEIKSLLKFGGWVSLTAILGPLLSTLDRFVIGAVLGATAVTEYTVPYQLANRVVILPGSLMAALYPRLSGTTHEEQTALARKATQTLWSLLLVPFLGAIFVVGPFLHVWVGNEVGPEAGAVARIILLGMWGNAFALIAFIQNEAVGRPDRVTKLTVLEIPPYFLLLYIGMTQFGLMGAAVATAARQVANFLLLTWAAERGIPGWPTHTGTMLFLSFGAWLASLWTITDWQWWFSSVLLLGIASAWSLHIMPADLRHQGFGRVTYYWRRWTGAWAV
jgi:O-antigen/teichoic acid export membrane protein